MPADYLINKSWTDDLRFYVLFNSTSGISGRWVGDNDRLYAMEPREGLKMSPPQAVAARIKPESFRSPGQRLTH